MKEKYMQPEMIIIDLLGDVITSSTEFVPDYDFSSIGVDSGNSE